MVQQTKSLLGGAPKFSELVEGTITTLESGDLINVTNIRDGAFSDLDSLTSVDIPSNVTTIGANAFSGCSNLQSLNLEEGVKTIGENAFNNTAISVLDIPASVISIGDGAFAGTNITEIDMSKHPIPPSITNTSFPSSLTTIKVAYRNYDTYLSEWSYYADKIVRLPAIPSTIRVVVNNYLGELVSGAVVTIEGNGQVYTGLTDSIGVFEQGDLQPATYTISVAPIEEFRVPDVSEVVVLEDTQNSVTMTYLEKPAVSRIFGENTPEQIAQVSNEIATNNMTSTEVEAIYGWKIGDTISYQLTTGENIEMRIIGFNHDDKSDGSGKAGITLDMTHCLEQRYPINSTATNAGGYPASQMKKSTLPTIKSTLPKEWQDVIKLVNKKSANGSGSNYSAIITSSEDLFLLSEIEAFGVVNRAQDSANEGSVYEYFKDTEDISLRVKASKNWWIRSCDVYNTDRFVVVNVAGGWGYGGALANNTTIIHTSFAFCV